MSRPLHGLRVLSLAENLPGPYATLVLADLGAEVLLVERPGVGDLSRQVPAMFAAVARGKRSVALDLKSETGRDAFLRLAADCDVVMEGFRPGTVRRLGVSYDDVVAVRPDIIYVSITGYGQDGPYRDRPGHDINFQGLAGMVTGDVPSTLVADLAAGTFAAVAVTTALAQRERTGRGAYVDVSMLDVLVSWQTALVALQSADNRGSVDRVPLTLPGYGVYRTADGAELTLGVTLEDHLWRDLALACGLEHVRGLSGTERAARCAELDDLVRSSIASRPLGAWELDLAAGNVAFSVCRTPGTLAEDPQVAARQLVTDPLSVRQPLVFDHVVWPARGTAPDLDEHAGQGWPSRNRQA
jgi:crotonobetainyl-CoA:carnitine CoA-transferase CaiB-like acyl-CoA transferase